MAKEKQTPNALDPPVKLSAKDILESLDREVHYYRTRLNQFFAYALTAQVLVATGVSTIPLKGPIIGSIIYTLFFLLIAVISTFFRTTYVKRIHFLKKKRNKLMEKSGFGKYKPFGPGGVMGGSKDAFRPSYLYLVSVWALSIIGVFIAWFSK